MTPTSVIVVGAGISGLAAAFRLQREGYDVTVLEAKPHVGGRMITIHWHGLAIDPGAEFVTGADKFLLEMVDHLGIRERLIRYSEEQTGFKVGVMRDGKVHQVNFMSILSYLSWSGVSFGARMSMVKLLPYFFRYAQTDVYSPEQAPGEDTMTMEQFFYEKISPEMFEYWAEPTMDVFCGYTPSDLSAKMMLLIYAHYLSQKLYTFDGGIGVLPEALAKNLNVNCNVQVKRIEVHSKGASVVCRTESKEEKFDADIVIVATPGDQVLPLFPNPEPAWKAFFPQVSYTRVGIVYHLLEGEEKIFDEGGIMFPRKEPWKLSALGWKRRPDGRVIAMSDLKAHLYDPEMSDDELKSIITQEALKAMPIFEGHIRDQMVFRWTHKVPTFRVGYLEALRNFKEQPQEGPIYFCGDYLTGPNTGAALASGWFCAERVMASS